MSLWMNLSDQSCSAHLVWYTLGSGVSLSMFSLFQRMGRDACARRLSVWIANLGLVPCDASSLAIFGDIPCFTAALLSAKKTS